MSTATTSTRIQDVSIRRSSSAVLPKVEDLRIETSCILVEVDAVLKAHYLSLYRDHTAMTLYNIMIWVVAS